MILYALLSSNQQKDTIIQELTEKMKESNEEIINEKQQKSTLTQQLLQSEKLLQEMEVQLHNAVNDMKSMSEREIYLTKIRTLEVVKEEKRRFSSAVAASKNREERELVISPMKFLAMKD
jgi:septal ring factor EnvC (AmiA/AmiB activator)